jgi:hypothetical protein
MKMISKMIENIARPSFVGLPKFEAQSSKKREVKFYFFKNLFEEFYDILINNYFFCYILNVFNFFN